MKRQIGLALILSPAWLSVLAGIATGHWWQIAAAWLIIFAAFAVVAAMAKGISLLER